MVNERKERKPSFLRLFPNHPFPFSPIFFKREKKYFFPKEKNLAAGNGHCAWGRPKQLLRPFRFHFHKILLWQLSKNAKKCIHKNSTARVCRFRPRNQHEVAFVHSCRRTSTRGGNFEHACVCVCVRATLVSKHE